MAWELPTRIYGFVDHMAELMAAADILITKAGPGTISEAFASGLPLILFSYIPGQETGNIGYVQANGAGVYAKTPGAITCLVQDWTGPNPQALRQMARNAACLARPTASLAIAEEICGLLDKYKGSDPGRSITELPSRPCEEITK